MDLNSKVLGKTFPVSIKKTKVIDVKKIGETLIERANCDE